MVLGIHRDVIRLSKSPNKIQDSLTWPKGRATLVIGVLDKILVPMFGGRFMLYIILLNTNKVYINKRELCMGQ